MAWLRIWDWSGNSGLCKAASAPSLGGPGPWSLCFLPLCRNERKVLEGWEKTCLSQGRVNMSSIFQIGILISGHIIFLTKQVFAPENIGQVLEGGHEDEGGDTG